jgi:uncharacterized protein (DUF4415 family)
MKMGNSEPISDTLLHELDALEARQEGEIDFSDAPEVTDWTNATRGFKRRKHPYSIRLDPDVVAWFKSSGQGYQTRINAALREYMQNHQKSA